MTFKITWEPQGVYIKFGGVVSGDDFRRAMWKVQSDGRFDRNHYQLVDCFDVAKSELSEDDLSNIAAQAIVGQRHNEGGRIVFVARGRVATERARRFADMEKLYPVNIFPTLEQARAWLQQVEGQSPTSRPQRPEHAPRVQQPPPGE